MNPYYPCSRHKLTNYEINWLHSFADLRKKMKESRAKNWKFSNNLKVTFRIIARVQIMVHNNVSSINSIKLQLTYISVISSGLLLCHVKLQLKKYKLKNMCTFVCKSSKVPNNYKTFSRSLRAIKFFLIICRSYLHLFEK